MQIWVFAIHYFGSCGADGESKVRDSLYLRWYEIVHEALQSGVPVVELGEVGERYSREGPEDCFMVELAAGAQ